MQAVFIFFLVAPVFVVAISLTSTPTPTPTWVGTYTPSTPCNSSTCCCFTGAITVSRPDTTHLQVSCNLKGQCMGATVLSTTTTYPSGYSTTVSIFGATVQITLSSDSRSVSLAIPAMPKCGVSAVKSTQIITNAWNTTHPGKVQCGDVTPAVKRFIRMIFPHSQ
jgi:hypothetical protein